MITLLGHRLQRRQKLIPNDIEFCKEVKMIIVVDIWLNSLNNLGLDNCIFKLNTFCLPSYLVENMGL